MDRAELIQYITDGIIGCLDKQPLELSPLAVDDVVQLAILREFFASHNDLIDGINFRPPNRV